MKIKEISQGLKASGYIPSLQISYAVKAAIDCNTPLLIEGDPGVGKTQLAKAVANMLNTELIRVQFYEGQTADKILFDYDYQRQLLTIQAISASLQETLKNKSIDECLQAVSGLNFYSEDFLIERPLLKAIRSNKRCVLLLDEVDKASEEIEYTLLEFLEDYSLSIPQLGTVHADEKTRPIVILTSNRYRELSQALRRRCSYLYIPTKTKGEMLEILKANVQANPALLEEVAKVMVELAKQSTRLHHVPSVAEAIEWTRQMVSAVDDPNVKLASTLGALFKDEEDYQRFVKSNGTCSSVFDSCSQILASMALQTESEVASGESGEATGETEETSGEVG